MDKSNAAVNNFTAYVVQLRTTECSQKEKISCFQHIAECIMSPALAAHINYVNHCSTATNVLLLFCEDLDAVVRMSAEENLNKIFRALEKTRVSRILMDLCGEIKRNGNQRSLRICLNLFSYYASRIKEKHVQFYAQRLLLCMQIIAQRKETQLCETLCEFVKSFSKYLQLGLTDSETCKLFEVFIANIGAECPVKRRCSSQNCISLIESARNKSLMAKHGLNKVIELLLADQQPHTVLGALGFLRLLLPLIIRGFTNDCSDDDDEVVNRDNPAARTTATGSMSTITTNESRQIVEIYDYCLHLLSTSNTSNHSVINAALEVVNAVLQALDGSSSGSAGTSMQSGSGKGATAKSLQQLLCNQQLQHNEYLRRRKSLKNQIFQLRNYEMTTTATATVAVAAEAAAVAADGSMLVSTSSATPARRTYQQLSAELSAGNMKITSGGASKQQDWDLQVDAGAAAASAGAARQAAYKLGMQKMANVKTQQQQAAKVAETLRAREAAEAVLPASTTTTWHAVGIHADEAEAAAVRPRVPDDVDVADKDDEARWGAECGTGELRRCRPVARSISECVADDADVDVDGDGGADADAEDDDVDEDDFTTLSEINEPQATTFALTTAIDVDNLMDAIDADVAADFTPKTAEQQRRGQEQEQEQQPQHLLTADDKSQFLSDIDNESFNSIDFEAEITIGGVVTAGASASGGGANVAAAGVTGAVTDTADGSKSSGDTIGSFFNHLISQSNAASESVSKLFRQSSSGSVVKPTSTRISTADKTDAVSTASNSVADTLSFASGASSDKRLELDAAAAEPPERQQDRHVRQHSDVSSSAAGNNEDTFSTTASITASTALLVDSNARNTAAECSSEEEEEEQKSPQRRVNPFLTAHSPLKQTVAGPPLLTLKIGSVYEQSMLYYTSRFVAARFLLTGQSSGLHSDATIRVSIKSLSLCVLAQCVRLAPAVLQLPLEITEAELRQLEEAVQPALQATQAASKSNSSSASGSPSQARSDGCSSSSQLGTDYEHLDAGDDVVDLVRRSPFSKARSPIRELPQEMLLLDIKDDHFGKSTCDHLLNSPLSKSADPVLFAQQLSTTSTLKSATPVNAASTRQTQIGLSKSEIIETQRRKTGHFRITQMAEDAPPPMLPPRPPKRTKSMRKSIASQIGVTSVATTTTTTGAVQQSSAIEPTPQQPLADILLYYNHSDPILRGGVQQIIGNFIQASGAGATLPLQLNLQHLLAILLKGLQDEIHTVVIQALNAFDKIFSHVVRKYLAGPSCHYQQQKQQQHEQWQQQGRAQQAESEQRQQGLQLFGKQTSKAAAAGAATTTTAITTTTARGQYRQHHQCDPNDVEHPKQTCMGRSREDARGWERSASSGSAAGAAGSAFIDNDELITALLNAFQLQTKCSNNESAASFTAAAASAAVTATATTTASATLRQQAIASDGSVAGTLFISPKLLLNKLRLCHHNKYWLVQNKYAEVISNLNYAALRLYYGSNGSGGSSSSSCQQHVADDVVCTYECIFLDELLQLIGDDDFRVREHAAACLCRYVIQSAQQQQQQHAQQQSAAGAGMAGVTTAPTVPTAADVAIECGGTKSLVMETYQTNFHLLWDFLDYRVFGGMSPQLRNIFRANSSIVPPLTDGEAAGAAATTAAAPAGDSRFATFALCRQMAEEEKVLARILYRMTNKLMELNDKNLQFGIIYAIKLLLKHLNFVDYRSAWTEFNFMEICMKYSYYNYVTATDLNCQNDLIDVTGKLLAGTMLGSSHPGSYQPLLEQLLAHTLKLVNIYYHIFTNQKPLLFAKAQKMDLFSNAKELAIVQSVGYFGSDYVYIKLYNTLRSANDSYKITINQESGGLLISLLKTCLNTLVLCIELRTHAAATVAAPTPTKSTSAAGGVGPTTDVVFPANAVLKLIEEILQYLSKLINYAPAECIACLRQLLRYLFAQNYGNRQQDYYATFIQPYFEARSRGQRGGAFNSQSYSGGGTPEETMCPPQTINPSAAGTTRRLSATTTATAAALVAAAATATTLTMTSSTRVHNGRNPTIPAASYEGSSSAVLDYRLFGELFVSGLNFPAWKSEREGECARHIKLFEPLVIYCLTLFMKSNATVQAPILELLSQLLDLNVTYSVLDSKNVIFNQIIKNFDLIESGVARNGRIIIPPMMKFLIQLTHKSDRKLITIPKVISIANNLLANNAVRGCALLALKTLAYEVFFMSSSSSNPTLSAVAEQRATFQSPVSCSPLSTPLQQRRIAAEEAAAAAAAAEVLLANSRELDTQKEVVLGMLEKFVDAAECQQVLGMLLLRECSAQQLNESTGQPGGDVDAAGMSAKGQILEATLLPDAGALYAIVVRGMCEGRIQVVEWDGFCLLDAFFRNNGKNVLADSKEFLSLLQLLITKDVENFCDLSYATIILANVILRTEEIYLVNHIKLFLKNHPTRAEQAVRVQQASRTHAAPLWLPDGPSTSSAAAAALAALAAVDARGSTPPLGSASVSEINYFAKVLCKKLEDCFACLNAAALQRGCRGYSGCDAQYCGLVVRFVAALHAVCCRSRHKDALQSVFRLVLAESEFLDKYYNFLTTTTAATSSTSAATTTTSTMMSGLCGTPSSSAAAAVAADEQAGQDAALLLQLEVFKLLSAMKLLDPLVLLQQFQMVGGVKWNVRRTLLREVCQRNPNPMDWNLQQVEQLFHAAHLNALILEHSTFVCNLCEVDEEFCSLLQRALLRHANVLNKHCIRALLRLVLRLGSGAGSSIQCTARFLQLLGKLHQLHAANRALQVQLERLARRLIAGSAHDKNAIYDSFIRSAEEEELNPDGDGEDEYGAGGQLQFMLLSDLENLQTMEAASAAADSRIIDEKWLFAQLIKFSTQPDYDPQQLTRILLEIQSENKLHKIFNSSSSGVSGSGGLVAGVAGSCGIGFDVARVLRHAIAISHRAMLAAFRNNCVQHNPHIHYMQPNPLVRVAFAVLMTRIAAVGKSATVGDTSGGLTAAGGVSGAIDAATDADTDDDVVAALHLCHAVIALMECIAEIEATALMYIEAKFVDKFLREHLLRPEHIATLLHFLDWCCNSTRRLLSALQCQPAKRRQRLSCIFVLLRCIECLLQQRHLWNELNQAERPCHALTTARRNSLLCRALDMLCSAVAQCTQHTNFYRRYKPQQHNCNSIDAEDATDDAGSALLLQAQAPKAIFVAKFIEAQVDANAHRHCPSHIAGAGATHGAAGGTANGGGSATHGSAGGATCDATGDFDGLNLEVAPARLNILNSIGISILRTNQFYAYAVTPFEIIQQQQQHEQQLRQQKQREREREQQQQQEYVGNIAACESPTKYATAPTGTMTASTTSGKLPTIPVESLSDVDVLRKFVKRLSIFGFTTRQQFEEYFMTFLLLINKVYDENMVDEQEQFQIKSTCLEAILELLITYKTFPIVGNKLSYFHHTTRWSRINCDGISLKKLHKVQLLVSESNIFYQPNLERRLAPNNHGGAADADTIIGTKHFLANQYDLNFVWQQMEAYTQPQPTADAAGDGGTDAALNFSNEAAKRGTLTQSGSEDVATRNYRHFTALSGVDFKSSSQLIFDVLTQIIEYNHILVLPNLVKFCEICESRDQIKWIRDKALKLQETIPMDDTISHQHLIYLACKTQAMLIPTLGELQQLCTLIGSYLKSSHVFIRNATLSGVLCLLECCSKTNTTMGRLSEELTLLRDLVVSYINRHGIIDESPMQCSDTHTKLVWTLNYCLIEWTSKFVPQCHLLSNTIIAASNFLRKTNNEDVYLCVLHGLERVIVINSSTGSGMEEGGGVVTPLLRHKIEKLALDLVKLENEKFSLPALKLLLSCIYMGSAKQLENTELSNGIVQDDPEIIAQQTDKVDILLHCIKSSTRDAAWIYGQVLCQIIRDLVPPNEILTKVIKEFLAINQPYCDVIAMIVYQVFRSAIDSSFLQMLQDWLICSLATFLALPERKGVWGLSVIFLSASINLHLIKLFPVLLSAGGGGGGSAGGGAASECRKLGQHQIALFITAAQDFYAKLSAEQKQRFRDAFKKFQQHQVYAKLLQSL